jgi:hypothetical protein
MAIETAAIFDIRAPPILLPRSLVKFGDFNNWRGGLRRCVTGDEDKIYLSSIFTPRW